jgi:LPXTG-motif cell wall-anchored protein
MRKILSVVLVVVMLAALMTVLPINAVTVTPDLLITEVCPDSTGLSGNGSDSLDCFEFIEIYNAGTTPVNLYDYTMAIGTVSVGSDPSNKAFEKVDPIQQKGLGAYNTAGTICTANYDGNNSAYYPKNPATAILEPGKTAVIWFVTGDAVAEAVARGSALTIDDFKSYHNMDDYSADALNNILVVAVDANGNSATTTKTSTYTSTGTDTSTINIGGVNSASTDANKMGGRFNLYNSSYKVYGIIKTADLEAIMKSNSGDITKGTFASCVSYAYANYDKADVNYNLMYKVTNAAGIAAAGSLADTSYNFIVSNNKVDLCYSGTGKSAGKIKYMGWDSVQYVTPGLLLPSQINNLTNYSSFGLSSCAAPNPNLAYVRNVKTPASYVSRVAYTAYLQNFYGMANSTDSDAILAALGWTKSTYLNSCGTARYSIVDGQLIVDNLSTSTMESKDSIVTIADVREIAQDDYTVEYQLTYLEAQENLRYAAVVYNFNGKCAYDIFILRVNGAGNNQGRNQATYTTYDDKTSVYYAPNSDANSTQTSLLNKITFGAEKVYSTTSTDISTFTAEQKAQYAPLVGRTLNVKVEVNQMAGPKLYVNDILVSEAANNAGVALNPLWGIKTNTSDTLIGLFVSGRVKVAIDNIKVTGYTEAYSDVKLAAQANANLVEPATGDATIYVAVAMAVSFISLAALVVVKRRKNEN